MSVIFFFQIVNKLLKNGTKTLPSCDSHKELSDSFAEFFKNKIFKIRQNLDNQSTHLRNDKEPVQELKQIQVMEEFHTVNEEDVRKIICKLPNKCCSFDVIPTWLLKQCMPTILPTLTKIVNSSLKSGTFPTSLKQAIVTPIIKKATLDPNELKNYRPVSNIKCFSKILESA